MDFSKLSTTDLQYALKEHEKNATPAYLAAIRAELNKRGVK